MSQFDNHIRALTNVFLKAGITNVGFTTDIYAFNPEWFYEEAESPDPAVPEKETMGHDIARGGKTFKKAVYTPDRILSSEEFEAVKPFVEELIGKIEDSDFNVLLRTDTPRTSGHCYFNI